MIGAFLLLIVPLCPLIDACRGINRTFCISMPHHWLLPGHQSHILRPYAPSLAFAGASHAHFASLCPIIDFCRGINRTFCISMPLLLASFQTNIRIKFKLQVINYTLQIVTYRFQITNYKS